MSPKKASSRTRKSRSKNSPQQGTNVGFNIGRVHVYLRGKVWYLRYHENGKRIQKRIGPDITQAQQLAAEINAQLECTLPSVFGFEQITLVDLRKKWLAFHEDIKRSSLATISRYRASTTHLVEFYSHANLEYPADLTNSRVEEFVRFLRNRHVAPNGHKNAKKRPLRDAGVKYILQCSSNLLNYAKRQKHLPPYFENPFINISIGRLTVEDGKPNVVFTSEEETKLLEASDEWLQPIMLTFLQTGLRPNELIHILLPENVDFSEGLLHIRNKPKLGWMVKTRTERVVPIQPDLARYLKQLVGSRNTGPLFRQRRCQGEHEPPLTGFTITQLEKEIELRKQELCATEEFESVRMAQAKAARTVWRDLGVIRYDYLRHQFAKLMKKIGRPEITALKTCRHNFATLLQDANVDPLIRNELLGHSPAGLGMTTRYTQTRPETKRKQLIDALGACASTRFLQKLMHGFEVDVGEAQSHP